MLLQFLQGPTASAQEQDDLLFFVYLELYQVCAGQLNSCVNRLSAVMHMPGGTNFGTDLAMMQAETPYFVRRKSKALPTELQTAGEKARQVDWKRSVLLNLVTQTTYSLTVSACTREHLQSVGSSRTTSPGSRQVMQRLIHTVQWLTSFAHCRHPKCTFASLAGNSSLA